MSTLTFKFRLPSEPHADDLLHMRVARAMVVSITGVPADQLPGGLISGRERIATFTVQRERILRVWLDAADALTNRNLCDGYEWHGEIEEKQPSITVDMEHEGKRYSGTLYAVETDEL